jgi:Leu/Phe-tRNA-protein transferase
MRWCFGRPWLEADDDFAACAAQLTAQAWPEEFAFADFFDAPSLAALCLAGFMPMSAELPVALSQAGPVAALDPADWRRQRPYLTPKLHLYRCLLVPEACHVSRSARRRAQGFRLTFDRAFDTCLDRCLVAHGGDWLTPPLVAAFRRLHGAAPATLPGGLRFVSVELWQDGDLAAGEIGYQAGAVYTSLSGFRGPSGAGTVQLTALAAALRQHGVRCWDLGMPMDYKTVLGAASVDRATFLASLLRLSRQPAASLGSLWPDTGQAAGDLLAAAQPAAPPAG